jgi:hypothetical protein
LWPVQQSRPGVTSQPRRTPSGTQPGPPKSGMNKHYVCSDTSKTSHRNGPLTGIP